MLGARAIGSRSRGLSPCTRGLAVDSLCPPLLSKRERRRLSQVSALCTLCSCLSASGWWGGHPVNTYLVGTRFGTPSALCPFCSLSTSGWWGGHPVNTYPVGTRFGKPPALCTLCSPSTSGKWGSRPMNTYPLGTRFGTPLAPWTLSSVLRNSSCHQGPCMPTVGVRQSNKSPRDAMLGRGLYASTRPGFQPQVGSVAEVSRCSRGVGLETRPGPIRPTPGMDVASLVFALASLSVWWRHGEWAPFPGYPLARGLRRSPAAPPPPPPPPPPP